MTEWRDTDLGDYVDKWDDPHFIPNPQPAPQPVRNVSPSTRYAVLARDRYTCQSCFATGVPLHVDHIHPVSRGGGNDPSNLQTLCAECNRGKGAR